MKVQLLAEGTLKWTDRNIVKDRWFLRGILLTLYAARTGDGGRVLELGLEMKTSWLPPRLEIPLSFEIRVGGPTDQYTVAGDMTVRHGRVTDLGSFQLLCLDSLIMRDRFSITIKSIDGDNTRASEPARGSARRRP